MYDFREKADKFRYKGKTYFKRLKTNNKVKSFNKILATLFLAGSIAGVYYLTNQYFNKRKPQESYSISACDSLQDDASSKKYFLKNFFFNKDDFEYKIDDSLIGRINTYLSLKNNGQIPKKNFTLEFSIDDKNYEFVIKKVIIEQNINGSDNLFEPGESITLFGNYVVNPDVFSFRTEFPLVLTYSYNGTEGIINCIPYGTKDDVYYLRREKDKVLVSILNAYINQLAKNME